MSEPLSQLEQEAEVMLTALATKLSVQPGQAVVERVKSVLQHELNEQWLTQQATPVPPADTVDRVRASVHAELQQAALPDRRMSRSSWPRVWGTLAAAAMIALCVGLIHYAGQIKPSEINLNLFVQVADDVFQGDSFSTAFEMQLDALEESIANLNSTYNDELYMLDDIGNQIDSLFLESDSLDDV